MNDIDVIVVDAYGNYATVKKEELVGGQVIITLDKGYLLKRVETKVTSIKDKK